MYIIHIEILIIPATNETNSVTKQQPAAHALPLSDNFCLSDIADI